MSKGHIIKQGQVAHVPNFTNVLNINDYRNIIGNVKNLTLPVGKFILPLKINQKMYGGAQLIVYYVRQNDGEVVAAVLDLEVEKCLSNKVFKEIFYFSRSFDCFINLGRGKLVERSKISWRIDNVKNKSCSWFVMRR